MGSMAVGMKKVVKFLEKESPSIFTGLGVSGVFTTMVLGAKATLVARDEVARENFERSDQGLPPLTPKQTVLAVWKFYIPTALSAVTTSACIIAANSISLKRNAVLASMYSLAEATLSEYQEKVVEIVGKNKEEKIRGEIAQDRLNENPSSKAEVIVTGKGETLFFDSLSGRYFKSDIQTIRRIQNDFNKNMLTEMYCSLSDLYDELGLPRTTLSNDVGWNIDNGYLDITFTAKIAENDQPCVVLTYKAQPKYC